MSEPPSEVYFRFPSEISDTFSYGSQHPENIRFKKKLEVSAQSKRFQLLRVVDLGNPRDEFIDPTSEPDKAFDYLGLADIEQGTGRVTGYERLLGRDILSKASKFNKGDIVFGRLRPYLNKVHLVEKEDGGIGSSELYVVTPDRSKVNPEFLSRYLLSDLTLTQTKWILTGNSYPRLAEEDFLNLSVLVPDVGTNVQDAIVSHVKELEKQAINASAKASALVTEAYGILSSRLSVEVPPKKEYDYYAISDDELVDRLDFNYNIPDYRQLSKELQKSPDVLKFSEILDEKRGLTNGVEIRRFVDDGTPYLRVSDVTGDELRLSEVERVATKLKDLKKDIKLEAGNLVISRSGTLGVVLLVDETFPVEDLILSSHLIRMVLKSSINDRKILPEYVTYFLRSGIGQMQFNQISLGSSVPEVSHPYLSEMRIVLPVENVQDELARAIKVKIDEASRYKQTAVEKWAESRKRFADTLLGDGVSD